MEADAKIEGLEEAMKAMLAAFPSDPKKQKQILNGAMRSSAAKAMLPTAKQMAFRGDSSGALSESLGIRNMNARALRKNGTQAGVQVLPVRANRKAMMMYIQHYYTSRGRTPKAGMITSGIRHGHLVEFGSVNNGAYPFLWPAATTGKGAYVRNFAGEMQKKTESAVKRARRSK